MSGLLASSVTQLLYKTAPNINLAAVVGEIGSTFVQNDGPDPVLAWDCDDIAVIDIAPLRVVIGYTEKLPGAHKACLTIAAGPAPQTVARAPDDEAPAQVCAAISDHLDARFPADDTRRQVVDHPPTPDLVDQVVDVLFQAPKTATLTMVMAPSLASLPPTSGNTEPGDLERLLNRLSSELTARAPSLISRAIASATPKPRQTTGVGNPSGEAANRNPFAAKVGLFWRKGRPQKQVSTAGLDEVRSDGTRRRASASELQAVREALYAGHEARAKGAGIALQTRHALQSLTALPLSLANAIIGKRRNDNPRPGIRVKQ